MQSQDMKEIMGFTTSFYETFYDPRNEIIGNSPEILFMEYIARGEINRAVQLFEENKLFTKQKSAVDAPQGRFEGLKEIKNFAESWLGYVNADYGWVEPVRQAIAGGRSATEMMLCFHVKGYEKPLKFPACIIGELRGYQKLDEIRMYFFFKWMPGLIPYRHRIFKPSYDEPCCLNAMSGIIQEYFDALHSLDQPNGMKRMLDTFCDDIIYNGYRPLEHSKIVKGKDIVRKKYNAFITMKQFVRVEVITDNGKTAYCEWVGVFRPKYATDEKDSLLQSGVGIYDRDPATGLLSSVRIIDNFKYEHEIDWSKVVKRY